MELRGVEPRAPSLRGTPLRVPRKANALPIELQSQIFAGGEGLEPPISWLHTTTVFTAAIVCGLDYAFTITFVLGG